MLSVNDYFKFTIFTEPESSSSSLHPLRTTTNNATHIHYAGFLHDYAGVTGLTELPIQTMYSITQYNHFV
jgi:hypothetical protein